MKNNKILDNENGICLYGSNNLVSNNSIFNNDWDAGIYIGRQGQFESNNNTISNNLIYSNEGNGIVIPWGNWNLIYNNTIQNNSAGIFLDYGCDNNNIFNNDILNNRKGICIDCWSNNTVYLNNIIDNTLQGLDRKGNNFWNSTSKITYKYNGNTYINYLGNYWGDYDGSDTNNDGIGDIPYTIDSNKDNYPLMKRFENYIISTGPKIIEVDDDFADDPPNHKWDTIQEGINDADDGNKVIVYNGTYYENVIIDKSVTLKGINSPAIDVRGCGTAITIAADACTIEGFKIISSGEAWGDRGVKVESNSNVIQNNTFDKYREGIGIESSSFNTLIYNTALNGRAGIMLDSSDSNTINNNIISKNDYGIYLWDSSNTNKLSDNNVLNNERGIWLYGSSNNLVYHNNLINNVNQAYDNTGANSWDNGYPSGGNYWSDYKDKYPDAKEIDESGIWDIPYDISGGAKDNYPLMEPWGVEQLPDLTLSSSDLSFSNPNPVVGDTVTITATIHNIGNADATDVVVQFFDGDPVNGMQIGTDQTIDLVSANGGIGTAQVGWTATEGVHEIYVVVDHSNAITEFDEENNIAFNTIIVGVSAPEHWFNNYYFNDPGSPYDSRPKIDDKFEEAPSELGGWGIRGYTWKWKKEGLFKIHEVQFVGKDVEENNYDVHMKGTDNTKTEEGYAVVSLLQGNAWNGYPEWYIPEPLTIDDKEIYIDTRLKRGDADESDDPHPTKEEISDREMYAVDLWFVESDEDPHTLTVEERCEKCQNVYLRRLVLDLIFHVGQKQQGVVEDNRDDGYDMAYPTRAEGKGVIFHYEPSVVSENYCSGFPKDEWLDCVAKHPFVGLPTEEWVSVEEICVNEYIRDAISLSQDASKWTWNHDSLNSEEVKFEDHSKLILCQGEMIIELRDADGELTVDKFDLYYYPKLIDLLPDLTLSRNDISFEKYPPTLGEANTIYAIIHNNGNVDATDITVQFFNGDLDNGGTQIGDDQEIDSIGAGDVGLAQMSWTIERINDIYVVIDPYDNIPETSEDNNKANIVGSLQHYVGKLGGNSNLPVTR